MTVASLGSSHSSAQRFDRFPKKILNNKCMKLNKIHLIVHVTWTILPSARPLTLQKGTGPPRLSLLACMAYAPEGNFTCKD